MISHFLSLQILNTTFRTSAWTSERPMSLASRGAPMDDMVALTGCPVSPYTSQNLVGNPVNSKSSMPNLAMRLCIFSVSSPGLQMPPTSPFMSEKNTGTPAALNDSASTLRVTVFPVPLAPVIRPCLLAISG